MIARANSSSVAGIGVGMILGGRPGPAVARWPLIAACADGPLALRGPPHGGYITDSGNYPQSQVAMLVRRGRPTAKSW